MSTSDTTSSPSPPTTNTLILVDCQNDFHPGGSLAIPTAHEDAERIAQFIRTHLTRLDRIVATLDTHSPLHLAHPLFWCHKDDATQHPAPFTIIAAKDLSNGTCPWVPRSDVDLSSNSQWCTTIDASIFGSLDGLLAKNDNNSSQKLDLQKYVVEYATRLERSGKFQLCIWPEHCLWGTSGHNLVPVLQEALHDWTAATGRTVEYVLKGQHLLTEMYSVICAEVPVSNDTSWNTDLLESLLPCESTSRMFVCGQALSHCVNYTTRDLVQHAAQTNAASQITLLVDASSAVPGFEAAAQQFVSDMEQAGVQLQTTTQVVL